MRIVRVRGRDAERLSALRGLFDCALRAENVYRYLADDRNLFLLAWQGGEPVGFLRGTELLQLRTSRPQFFLYEVGVLPSSRRQGVARALLVRLLRHGRSRGWGEIFVLTTTRNTAARALYRSTGGRTETPGDRMFVYDLSKPSQRGPTTSPRVRKDKH